MDYGKVYIAEYSILSVRKLFMLGIEKIVEYFRERNQPKEIEIPPGTIILDYNPAITHLTKERIREMVPPEIRKQFERLTGVKLGEELDTRGQLPEGVELIPFNHKELYGDSKKSDYQR